MFVSEFVVPLVLNRDGRTGPSTNEVPPWAHASASLWSSSAAPANVTRLKTPGSDWLYAKLYCAPSLQDDLLQGPLSELVQLAWESRSIDRWFFIRYSDPDPHIRLRFHGSPAALLESLLPKFLSWANGLVERDLCLRFMIDSYERETERYGGPHAIETAERLFCLDSGVTLGILRELGSACPLNRVEFCVSGLDFLFRSLGSCLSERSALFQEIVSNRHESGQAYRERKKLLLAALTSRGDADVVKAMNQIASRIERNVAGLAEIGARLRDLEAGGLLTRPLREVYRSLAHMHCNRLGLNSAEERLAYGLASRTYDALQSYSKNRDKPEVVEEDTTVGQFAE